MRIIARDGRLEVDAPRFAARFEGAALVAFQSKPDGVEFCRRDDEGWPLELTYTDGSVLQADVRQRVQAVGLSDLAARVILEGADSDRELFVRLDPKTGDLCVTPSGQSARRGVAAVRWNIPYVPEATLVLPGINGLSVATERPYPGAHRFRWPFEWNAQLAIAQRDGVSMMVHAQDARGVFKALNLARAADGRTTLGYDSEEAGPLAQNRAAGGVEWRLNAYKGDWRVPADRYRQWMETAYDLAAKRAGRPAWVDDIAFTVQWCALHPPLLDQLATLFPPQRTLLHVPGWRSDGYDINYPDYNPSPEGRAFVEHANALGFHVMPHFNYFACWERHPLYARLRDWQVRDPYTNAPLGWYWPPESHEHTRMGYIHPGLALWRRTLIDRLRAACDELDVPAAFIDQTLCVWNADNALVENANMAQGLKRLQEQMAAIDPAVVLAGEGCHEISFQRECFAQAHILDGWRSEGLGQDQLDAVHPIGSYLWRDHTRLVGYYHLSPFDDDLALGAAIYQKMGAMPTIDGRHGKRDVAAYSDDNPILHRILEAARAAL
ncbi:MAG: hypothetical protein J7M15_01945 [Anaerolineae bacterium]|nr:hypothetical protein [Anaerolineae bacterium]